MTQIGIGYRLRLTLLQFKKKRNFGNSFVYSINFSGPALMTVPGTSAKCTGSYAAHVLRLGYEQAYLPERITFVLDLRLKCRFIKELNPAAINSVKN
jgi:hypothetical protein